MSWHTPVNGPESSPNTGDVNDVATKQPSDKPQHPIGSVRLVDINRLLSTSPPQPLLKNVGNRMPVGMDEFEAVSVSVAAKLKKMNPTQRIYAELLINKVLTYGMLCDLSETSDVVNFQHSTVVERHSGRRNSVGHFCHPTNSFDTIIL